MPEPVGDSSSKPSDHAPTPLPYAASLARDRVSIERGPNYLRVISPPIGSWRQLPRGYHVVITVLGLIVGLLTCLALIDPSGEGRAPALANAAVWAGILLVICAVAYDRVRRSVVFELTGDALSLTRLTPWTPPSTQSWRRDRVGEIRVPRASGRLVIHVIGREMVELWLGPDRIATERVAAALRDGLAAMADAGPPPREVVALNAMPPGPGRTALIITACVLSLTGVAVAVFVDIYLAMVPFILAGIPAGMALGTRETHSYTQRLAGRWRDE
jgi:hypothetical protein